MTRCTGTGGGGAGSGDPRASSAARQPGAPPTLPPNVAYDLSLQHPRCVFQLLKRQYSRYTPEMVERITGIPKDQFLKAADLFTSVRKDGDMKKAATIIYAVGWTQHTFGTQIIRTAAILQLLLGNVGRAGGGVNALRGHSNIQGATDMAGVFDILPGYLKMPAPADTDFAAYLEAHHADRRRSPSEWDSFNYWSNTPKFAVSFLKAMYGDAATKDNDWAFHYLPKIDRNYSWTEIWDDMYRGKVKGMLAFGMNGVAIGPNSQKNIEALKKADWLVVGEIYPDETSEFWKAPGITHGGDEEDQDDRLPPAVRGVRREGRHVDNSARWLQWKNAALPPPGQARLDQDILAQIFLKVRELYQKEGGKFPDPDPEPRLGLHRSAASVARRSGARRSTARRWPTSKTRRPGRRSRPASSSPASPGSRTTAPPPAATGSTAGRWTEAGPQIARRGHGGSVRPRHLSQLGLVVAGQPPRALQPRLVRPGRQALGSRARGRSGGTKPQQKWVGNDVPDFKADSHPEEHMGPFIMNAEGVGRLFAPLAVFADGPFPEHYEPIESPVANPLHPQQSTNPVVKKFDDGRRQVRHDGRAASTWSAPRTGSPSTITTGPRTTR